MSFLRLYNISRLSYLLALILILPLVACSGGDGGPASGTAVVSWVAPAEREDGSALALSAIAGYRIYFGGVAGIYPGVIAINDSSATQASLSGVPSGTYFAVMTTVDLEGRESAYSTEVVLTI